MKKTFKELQEIDFVVGALYKATPTLRETKFGYAYTRFKKKNYDVLVKDFQEELADMRANNALEDPHTKEILIDKENPRGYKYSKEGLIKTMKEERAMETKLEDTAVEVTPFISAYIPEDLTDEQREALEGLLIEKEKAPVENK